MLSHSPHSETVHGPRAVNYPDTHTVGVPNGLKGTSPPWTTDDIKAVVEVSASAYSWSWGIFLAQRYDKRNSRVGEMGKT